MTLGKAAFGRNKKGGEEYFSKKNYGGEDFFFQLKKGGRRLFFRQIFPKTRPRYPVNFDRSLSHNLPLMLCGMATFMVDFKSLMADAGINLSHLVW